MKNGYVLQFLTALRFLTILPVKWNAEHDSDNFQESVKFFSAVGLLIGAAGALLTMLFSLFLPHAILCCTLILYLSLISGFLHLDGLADSADGFFSSRPREQILTIMRDSRTGAMGVLALVFLLLFKFSAFYSLAPEKIGPTVFLLPLAGRSALVFTMWLLPYARKEEGLGSLFFPENHRSALFMTALGILIAGAVVGFSAVLLMVACIAGVVLFFGWWCKKIIGGVTGDTLGAVCEITETAVALAFAVSYNL